MDHLKTNEFGKVSSGNDVEGQIVVDEVAEHCANFLLRTWLLMDKMLPDKYGPIKGASARGGRQALDTSYSNFVLFLCVTNIMDEKGSLTMTELKRYLSITESAATRMVDWMEGSKYAERLSESDDRRIVRVALTDEGRNVSKAAKRYLFKRATEFLDSLPKEVKDSLKAVLNSLPKRTQVITEKTN